MLISSFVFASLSKIAKQLGDEAGAAAKGVAASSPSAGAVEGAIARQVSQASASSSRSVALEGAASVRSQIDPVVTANLEQVAAKLAKEGAISRAPSVYFTPQASEFLPPIKAPPEIPPLPEFRPGRFDMGQGRVFHEATHSTLPRVNNALDQGTLAAYEARQALQNLQPQLHTTARNVDEAVNQGSSAIREVRQTLQKVEPQLHTTLGNVNQVLDQGTLAAKEARQALKNIEPHVQTTLGNVNKAVVSVDNVVKTLEPVGEAATVLAAAGKDLAVTAQKLEKQANKVTNTANRGIDIVAGSMAVVAGSAAVAAYSSVKTGQENQKKLDHLQRELDKRPPELKPLPPKSTVSAVPHPVVAVGREVSPPIGITASN